MTSEAETRASSDAVYSQIMGVACVMLRYFNVFGPRQDPKSQYAAVIPKFIECAQRGEASPIFGDGKQTRDFTFIGNVIEANLKACTAEGVGGEVFNIACGERVSLLDLVDEINAIVGTGVEPELRPARAGDIRDSYADISKANEMLGYLTQRTDEQGEHRIHEPLRALIPEFSGKGQHETERASPAIPVVAGDS